MIESWLPRWLSGKESFCQCCAGDAGLIPGSGRPPGEGNGNSLQYSFLGESQGQRNMGGYSWWGRRESDMPGNPGTTYCYTIESQVQDPHLVAQRFLPLSNNSFHGQFGSWRRVIMLGPMRKSMFGEKESSQFTGQGLQGSGAGQTSVAGTLRLRGTFYSPRLSTGSLCRALGSTVHLPIWPDEEQGDCVIKRESLRKRK